MDETKPVETSVEASSVEGPVDPIPPSGAFDASPPAIPPTHYTFSGPSGVGWGFLLYLLMCVVAGALLSFVAQAFHAPRIWGMLIGEGIGVCAAMIPAVVMARLEGRSFGEYGLPRAGAFGAGFWQGLLWGLASLTLLMLALRAFNAFYFGSIVLHGLRIFKFAIFWGVVFLVVGFFEEFLLRGYTQFTLSRGLGFWPTAIILSTSFGAMHIANKGESLVGAAAAALIGLFFCLTLRRTGNLWFAVGLHASWDWGETYLYSVPNSGLVAPGHLLGSSFQGSRWLTGGSVGPEGSVLVFAVIAAMWIVFDRTHRVARYPN